MTETVKRIEPGRRVVMHFSLTLADGTVAEDTFNESPFEFTVGDGVMVAGLEYALYGLTAGEEQTVTMTPAQTYGRRDPNNIHTIPLAKFPADLAPQEGQVIAFTAAGGVETPAAIKEVTADRVTVDFNHPLAGHNLTYRVKILSVD